MLSKSNKWLIILFLFLFFLVIKYINYLISKKEKNFCFNDPIMQSFTEINRILHKNITYQKIILIINSIMFDSINWYLMLGNFIYKGKSMINIITIGLFYFIRQMMFNFFLFPIPKNSIFENPNFPSIFIIYNKTNDFFYSGHCGNMLFNFLWNYKLKNFKLSFISLYCLFFTMLLLIVYGGHYSIDIIIGIITMIFIFIKVNNKNYKIKYKFLLFLENIWIIIKIRKNNFNENDLKNNEFIN